MASDPRQQRLVLTGLLVVLLGVAWWQLDPFGSGPSAAGAKVAPPTARPGPGQATPVETLTAGVGLDRLSRVPPAPVTGGRDPFVLGTAEPEPGASMAAGRGAGGGATMPTPSVPAMPVVPTAPPGPPPITVKFIGLLKRDDVGRVAVLSDGRNVYYGREGEIVDGRWRIVHVGEESLQIEYVDGRGRQTVRLTG